VKITTTETKDYYVSFQHQRDYDPDDGQQPGWYAWVAPAPNEQSDFVFGPYKSRPEAQKKSAAHLRGERPENPTAKRIARPAPQPVLVWRGAK
jgi:hypothetical protein